MWSLGVTLFLMLGGYHLFDGSRESDVARRDTSAKLAAEFARAPWAGVGEGARALVRALLAPAPGARPGAAAVLAHGWMRAGPEQAIATAPPPLPGAAAGVAGTPRRALPRREATFGVPTPPHRERTAAPYGGGVSMRQALPPHRAVTARREVPARR
jgi:hypothetical protein